MAISRFVPPIDYLKEASRSSLQSFELARLNHAANLRREIGALMDQWIQETSEAMLARWMLDQRVAPNNAPLPTPDIFNTFFETSPDPSHEPKSGRSEIVPAPPRFTTQRHANSAPQAGKTPRNGTTAG